MLCSTQSRVSMMDHNLRSLLEQIERYGELRDAGWTRYQKSVLLGPAVKRRFISWEIRRGRYELTQKGRRRLEKMRCDRRDPTGGLSWGILVGVVGLAVVGPCVDAWAPGLPPVRDELRPSLQSDRSPSSGGSGPPIATVARATKDQEVIAALGSSSAASGAAPMSDDRRSATRSPKPSQRAHGSDNRGKPTGETKSPLSIAPLVEAIDPLHTQRAQGSPYQDERYSGLLAR
jgi:hypothetical protein